MRAFIAGTLLLFVGACAAISGLDDPTDASSTPSADAGADVGPPPSVEDGAAADTGPSADAAVDADADAMPTSCDENGLVGRWRFDEGTGTTAHDCTSGKHDGTITGAMWATGKVGAGALRFTGDSVDLGNPQAFQIVGAITLAAWIYPTSTASAGRIVSKSSQSDRGWELNIESGGILEFKVATDTTSFSEVATTIGTGQWRHVAGVYSPGASMRLYIDGVEVASNGSAPSAQRNAPHDVLIGAMPGETCCRFEGDIDDVRIYSRALSASEVKALMAP